MEEYPSSNSTLETETPEETKKETQTEAQIVERVSSLKKQYEQATVDSRTQFAEIYSVYMGIFKALPIQLLMTSQSFAQRFPM